MWTSFNNVDKLQQCGQVSTILYMFHFPRSNFPIFQFSAFLSLTFPPAPGSQLKIRQLLNLVPHRAPEGLGVWEFRSRGLGYRRPPGRGWASWRRGRRRSPAGSPWTPPAPHWPSSATLLASSPPHSLTQVVDR